MRFRPATVLASVVAVLVTASLSASAFANPTSTNPASADPTSAKPRFANPTSANSAAIAENWQAATSPYFDIFGDHGSVSTSGVDDQNANDGKALQLQLAKNPVESPSGAATANSKKRYLYGTFESRLKTADCSMQPKAGVVTGQLFTYFNDGTDTNGNGLPDNSEIDFETLCAEPEVIYLTIWTDFRASDEAHRRVHRAVNLRTGEILATCYSEAFGWENCEELTGPEAQPAHIPAVPDFDSSARYYDYGFTWKEDRVTYWIEVDGKRITLWDYRGPAERIPHVGAYLLHNVWHTSGWTPIDDPDAVERPTTAMNAWIDWTRITSPN